MGSRKFGVLLANPLRKRVVVGILGAGFSVAVELEQRL